MTRISVPGVAGAFSTRADGDLAFWSQPEEAIRASWQRLTSHVPGQLPLPCFANQVHEDTLLTVDAQSRNGSQGAADGIISVSPGVPIGVFTADCLPILIAGQRTVAAVHSGWRSAARNIAGKAIAYLVEVAGERPADLTVWAGPCIGACCLEMGEEVPQEFISRDPMAAGFFSRGRKWHLDLRGLVTMQVLRAGVSSQNLHHINDCTKCQSDKYFSYRGQRGRQGSLFSWIVRVE